MSDGIIGALGKAREAIQTFDFEGLGANAATGFNKIVTSVQTLFANIDFKTIGSEYGGLISDAIKGMLDTAIGFLQNVNWQEVGTTIWTYIKSVASYVWGFLTGVDWGGVISRVFELLGSALGAAAGVMVGLGTAIWESLKTAWDKVKEYFTTFKDEAGGNFWQGLWDGIVNAATGIYEFFRDKVVKPFIEGFKKAFGIASPSTVMAEQGTDIIDGLKKGIEDAWNKAKGWFDEKIIAPLKGWFSEAWDNIKGFATDTWTDIETVWTTVSTWFYDNVTEPTKTFFSDAWTDIKGFFTGTWDDIKGIWQDAGTWFNDNVVTPISDFFKSGINNIIEFINGLIGAFESAINYIIGGLNTISISLPDWEILGELAGKTFGVNITPVGFGRIPYLASGAVIPPNAPFMAVVGDQRSGTNIEAPEALIRQIVREEVGGMSNQNITITFGGTMGELVRQLKPHIERENSRVGNTMLAQAVRVS